MTGAPVAPAAAAALIIARPGTEAPEILLLKRSSAARFMPNAYVFPGGGVDGDDATQQVYALCADLDDAAASERLGLPRDGLRFFVAALRESFEECGLLYASDVAGRLADLTHWDDEQLHRLRTELLFARTGLAALCVLQGWQLAVDRLIYFAHWITPEGLKRRFDTRFFIARAPHDQHASLAGEEMADLIWISAREALARYSAGHLDLRLATRTLLGQIAPFDAIDALFDFAREPRKILPVTPPPQSA